MQSVRGTTTKMRYQFLKNIVVKYNFSHILQFFFKRISKSPSAEVWVQIRFRRKFKSFPRFSMLYLKNTFHISNQLCLLSYCVSPISPSNYISFLLAESVKCGKPQHVISVKGVFCHLFHYKVILEFLSIFIQGDVYIKIYDVAEQRQKYRTRRNIHLFKRAYNEIKTSRG